MHEEHKMGGTYEIDESLFTHYKDPCSKEKKQVWIVGIIQRDKNEARVFQVANRSAETLTKLIKDNVEEGSTIVIDQWKGYSKLNESYNHIYLNKSSDEAQTDNTNQIEGYWGRI
jgi:co-chaperonin GroES (HSP10)